MHTGHTGAVHARELAHGGPASKPAATEAAVAQCSAVRRWDSASAAIPGATVASITCEGAVLFTNSPENIEFSSKSTFDFHE